MKNKGMIITLIALLTILTIAISVLTINCNPNSNIVLNRQSMLVEEALKHTDDHYLFSAEGQIGNTTPFNWDNELCRTEFPKNCTGVQHFDCSGFVFYCANEVGYNISWTGSHDQYHPSAQSLYDNDYCTKIMLSKLQPGSLVFKVYPEHVIFHVGIYVGNKTVIECTKKINGFKGVQLTSWSSWLAGNYSLLAGNLLYSPK